MKHNKPPPRSYYIGPDSCPGSTPPLQKDKRKEVHFDKFLKKETSRDLKAPFCFDILAQLANIPARITLHKMLRLSKKKWEHFEMHLLIQNFFLMQVPAVSVTEGTTGYNVIR